MSNAALETISGNLYDYPRYYDLVFGSDWKAEFDFLTDCFEKHASGIVQRLFEPACGTGRLLYRFAKAGFDVSGLDLNESAISFCNERLTRNGFPASCFVGEMAAFRLPQAVDAAFNTINSFRHLATEDAARNHLQCVADSLRTGGLYVLGLHLTPLAAEPVQDESWSAARGHLRVNSHLWITDRDLRSRQERCAMTYDVYTPTRSFRIAGSLTFRTYTAAQMERLLQDVKGLEIVTTYDFAYHIEQPIQVGPGTEDVVYVLRKA